MKAPISRLTAPTVFKKIPGYLCSCFLLTVPVLVWDLLMSKKLPPEFQPEFFWKDIPIAIAYGENISRSLLFACLVLMPLTTFTASLQKLGLLWYIVGILLYYASWLLLICYPDSHWHDSILGFMAPAYTPACWLVGIGLMGRRFYFPFAYTKYVFVSITILFLAFHNLHTYWIYARTLVGTN